MATTSGSTRVRAYELDAEARITAHEEICAVRWAAILQRIGRLETIIIACAGTLIAGMGALIVTLALRGHT